jgi:DNA polymerase-3 subunit epsilon
MREIVFDTETTGLNPQEGHRIIELGCVELMNHIPTGKTFHAYVNPERDVPAEASAVSGLTTEFLRPYPVFSKVVDGFLDFIQDSPFVIHNAAFDIGFLNAEFGRLNLPEIPLGRAVDTVKLARKKFPGAPANLDALCRRFDIDLSVRTKHGALLDAQLLAKVYLELIGGRQTTLIFESAVTEVQKIETPSEKNVNSRIFREPRSFSIPEEEFEAHRSLVEKIKNPLWQC